MSLLLWLFFNVVGAALATHFGSGSGNVKEINTGELGSLEIYSLFIASLMLFRLIFAVIYLLKWNCRQSCCKYYGKGGIDIEEEFQNAKRMGSAHESSDEDDDDDDPGNDRQRQSPS